MATINNGWLVWYTLHMQQRRREREEQEKQKQEEQAQLEAIEEAPEEEVVDETHEEIVQEPTPETQIETVTVQDSTQPTEPIKNDEVSVMGVFFVFGIVVFVVAACIGMWGID